MLGSLAIGLALLRRVDAVQSNLDVAVVAGDLDGVAVKDGDDLAGEVTEWSRDSGRWYQEG